MAGDLFTENLATEALLPPSTNVPLAVSTRQDDKHPSRVFMRRGITALLLYCLIAVVGGLWWSPFSAVPGLSEELYGMSTDELTWQQNFCNIAQGLCTPISAWMLTKPNGLSVLTRASGTAYVVQCVLFFLVLKTPSHPKLWQPLAALASVMGGMGSAFIQGSISQLSATWFVSDRSISRCTAMAFAANYFGICASQLWATGIVSYSALEVNLICGVVAAGVTFVLLMVWFPSVMEVPAQRPTVQIHNDVDATKNDEANSTAAGDYNVPPRVPFTFWESLTFCAKHPTVILLILTGAILQGTFFAWQANIPLGFLHYGTYQKEVGYDHAASIGHDFTAKDGNLFCFLALLAYATAGFLSGDISEVLCYRRGKTFQFTAMTLSVTSLVLLTLVLPSPLLPVTCPGLNSMLGMMHPKACYWVVLCLVTCVGFFSGLTVPTMCEMLAEVSFPVPEGVTANGIFMLTQLFALMSPTAIQNVSENSTLQMLNVVSVAAIALSALLMAPTQLKYSRRDSKNVALRLGSSTILHP
eukprot:m.97236 g.97236  ORF g.97236 m.97236 type:complete len:528 (-) comp16693_c0_seq5:527-2110(-)